MRVENSVAAKFAGLRLIGVATADYRTMTSGTIASATEILLEKQLFAKKP